jgi:hypothetical protein
VTPAIVGLIVISCASILFLPAALYFAVREMRLLVAGVFEYLDKRPTILGKPEALVARELELKDREMAIREKDADAARQIQLEQSWSRVRVRRQANQNGASAAEMIESGMPES